MHEIKFSTFANRKYKNVNNCMQTSVLKKNKKVKILQGVYI